MNPTSLQPQTISYDLVLLPSKEQSQLAIQASQQLAAQGSFFTLDDQDFYAHLSLYMFQIDIANQDACVAALRQLANRAGPQQFEQDGYFYQDSGHYKGYVDIAYTRNQATDSLQMQAITTFNGLRSGMRESDKNKMADATGLKLENLQKYGCPAIGELFRPHVTLTRFPTQVEPDLSGLPDPALFTGMFTRIGLFEMGQNGTCIRKIAEFSLAA